MLGIEDRNTFPLIFLRENCADMAIAEADVEEAYIASSKALLITGTHLSTEYINRISTLALERARKNDVRTVLDIDYRPVLWGLTKRGDGETRYIRSDNGPEFTARAVRKWLRDLGARSLYIEPGSPWENGYIESFNGKFRDEVLNREIFYSLQEAQVIIEQWRREYNTVRPHSALGYRPPAPEAILEASEDMVPATTTSLHPGGFLPESHVRTVERAGGS